MIHDLGITDMSVRAPDRVVVGPGTFDDPRMLISVGVLGKGDSVAPRPSGPGREEAWIVLDLGVETLGAGVSAQRREPGVLAGFSGSVHGLANPGTTPIRYIRVTMGDALTEDIPAAAPADPEWAPLDQTRLEATRAHDGMGEIGSGDCGTRSGSPPPGGSSITRLSIRELRSGTTATIRSRSATSSSTGPAS